MKIEILDLKKIYGNQTVLDIEKLNIHANAITAIVGPNGAGKTTLFKIIAGLSQGNHGTLLYNHSTQIPYSQMTLVFQEPYLIHTSVQENIAYPLKIRKYTKEAITERINQLASDLHIENLLTKKADQLSLGEVQKVALARALSFQPDLLLLDEPCANIDPHTTLEIENILTTMENTTILLITHNLSQAKRIADYVILMNQGKVIEQQDSQSFFLHPIHEKTRKFIEGELLI